MIDTSRYEGHTPAPWIYDLCYENGIIVAGEERITIVQSKDLDPTPTDEFDNIPHDVAVSNIHLIADAPLLLEEVKRLRELIKEIAQHDAKEYWSYELLQKVEMIE